MASTAEGGSEAAKEAVVRKTIKAAESVAKAAATSVAAGANAVADLKSVKTDLEASI